MEFRDEGYVTINPALLSDFLGQRLPNFWNEFWVVCTALAEIDTRLGQAQRPVWPATHFICIMVILPVVFPIANWA
jgi:hypothetical protein